MRNVQASMTKFFQFFGEVYAELQKVVWPTKKETIKYTLTVIAFSIVVSIILGAADFALLKIFEKIITK